MKLTIQNRVVKVDGEPNPTRLIIKEFKHVRMSKKSGWNREEQSHGGS